LAVIKQLRAAGISAEIYPDSAKMKKQMGRADTLAIPYVAIVGETELADGTISLKDMASGEQQRLTLSQLIDKLK
ncbi:MAG: histidine--tRNA ligase, partial [Duncaniella sp.]|nr:histidine--tRNA ligase [Duncaniella sp.]